MKKSKKIKLLTKQMRLLQSEVELQTTIIANQRQAYTALEQAVRGVRAGQPNPGVSDFGRGWSQCMSEVETALLMAQSQQRHPSVRVIDKMELVGVSLDLHGDPHSEIHVVEAHDWLDEYNNHYINVGPHGWTVQHPLSCRPNLFACPVTKAAEAHDWSVMEVDPYPTGTYPCTVTETGELVIDLGASVTPVIDIDAPITAVTDGPSPARYPIKDNPQA